MQLSGRTIVVTGGSRGIGKAIVETLCAQGASVHVLARSPGETASACVSHACDVSDSQQVKETLAGIEKSSKGIYGLICAAGILGPTGNLEACPEDEIEQTLRVNLLGPIVAAQTVLPAMKSRQQGRIVLFSGAGQGPHPFRTAYAASKGAIWRLTESLGHETAPFGVFVNAIAPGAVNTQFLESVLEAGPDKVGQQVYEASLKQKAAGGVSPQKAADLCLYLMSEKARGLSGKTLSAVWDDYHSWTDLEALSESKWYTFSRLVPPGPN